MKEIVQFKESDKEMIEALQNLKKEAKRVFDMWESRFNEMATAWREHRDEIIEELGGPDSEEFDLTDMFFVNVIAMRNALSSPCNVLSGDYANHNYHLKYIKPIEELRQQEVERIKNIKKK